MKPKLEVDNKGLLLDYKAHRAIIDALDFQLSAWRAVEPEDMDEDDFIDLQNDIGYLETLVGSLKADFESKY